MPTFSAVKTGQAGLAVLCSAVYISLTLGLLRVAICLPLAAAGFAAALCLMDVRSGPKVRRREILIALGFSLLLAWLLFAVHRDGKTFYRAGFDSTGLFCSAWLFTLSLPWFSGPRICGKTCFLILVLCFFAATSAHLAIGRQGRMIKVDETLYRYQAEHTLAPPYGAVVPAGLETAVPVRFSFIRDGVLRTQYPPGWPVVIKAASELGLKELLVPALCSLCLVIVYFGFSPLWGGAAAIAGAALLACSPYFAYQSTTLYAHALIMVIVTACIALRQRLATVLETPARRAAYSFSLGFLASAALSVRPLAGLCLAAALVLWMLADLIRSNRLEFRRVTSLGLWASAGALLPLAFLLHYNQVTTGNPLHFGYMAANGELHNLGFGRRGMVIYAANGVPRELAVDFNIEDAVYHFLQTLSWAGQKFVPMCFPVFAAVLALRLLPGAGFYLLLLSILPLAHFFYPFASPRFWSDLLPLIAFGTGAVIVALHRRWQPIVAVLAITSLVVSVDFLGGRQAAYEQNAEPYFRMVEEQRQPGQPLLVLVKESDQMEPILNALFIYNSAGFSGDVLVMRDTGNIPPELAKNRRVVLIEGPKTPGPPLELFNPN